MTIQEALKKGTDILKLKGLESPALEAGVLLCRVLKCDRAFLYAHGEFLLKEGEKALFLEYIRERSMGRPLQHLTGKQEFMSLDFAVSGDVLVPRQETEVLVEAVIKHVKNRFKERKTNHAGRKFIPEVEILDIGTGSGCIGISLAYYLKNCRVTAVDISEKALERARENALRNGVEDRMTFVCADILKCGDIGFKTGKSPKACGYFEHEAYDVLVSNPPYIPSCEIAGLQKEVREYEPYEALDGGRDGLLFYRAIAFECVNLLKPDGMVALEVGYGQANEVAGLFREHCYDINILKDLSGGERVITGLLKSPA